MQFVTPEIFHIGYTTVDLKEIYRYLAFLGALYWHTDAASDAEELVEIAGRRCYKSFGTELNPNITRVREGNQAYIGNILKTKHGSVIEHAYDTFAFENVSRVFTHEMVRHRLCNFSQESMRFVRPTALTSIFPQVYTDHLPPHKARRVQELFKATFESIEDVQKELVDICGMDEPGLSFATKKLFQSANRRLIPDGVTTGIIVTANHRTWRFITQLRTDPSAEEEIRYVFFKVFQILKKRYPAIYQDGQLSEEDSTIYATQVHAVKFDNWKI